eukprot:377881_1
MLDRLHTLLKHSQDKKHTHDRNIQKIRKGAKYEPYSTGVYVEYFSLSPLYPHLLAEVTQNEAYSIAPHQFKSQLDAVILFMNPETKSNILLTKACKTDKKQGIEKGDSIGVQHILCMMLYSNFSDLCRAFRTSYRKIDYEDTNEIIISRHVKNFYWFGRWLTNAIDFFGRAAKKGDQIYTGLSCKCLF